MVRINRVYTRVGDTGTTSLIGGEKVPKSALRIECYGTVDEVNAHVGMALTAAQTSASAGELRSILRRIQNELFNLGGELATPSPERVAKMPHIEERHVEALEADIDRLNDELEPLKSFVLPGGGPVSANLHVARTVCRRAERLVVRLADEDVVRSEVLRYLNRLSDAFFVFGRWAVKVDGVDEPLWTPETT